MDMHEADQMDAAPAFRTVASGCTIRTLAQGGFPERPKGSDCKSDGYYLRRFESCTPHCFALPERFESPERFDLPEGGPDRRPIGRTNRRVTWLRRV